MQEINGVWQNRDMHFYSSWNKETPYYPPKSPLFFSSFIISPHPKAWKQQPAYTHMTTDHNQDGRTTKPPQQIKNDILIL